MTAAPTGPGPRELGRAAEDAAASFLKRRGFDILTRNYHTPYGELDLVARAPDGTLVFAEVKAGAAAAATRPRLAFTPRKVTRVFKAAQLYLQTEYPGEDADYRFDFLVVTEAAGRYRVEHHTAVPIQDWLGGEELA